MNFIPPTLTNLANSKKAVTFWVILALWFPIARQQIGLSFDDMTWITIAFCAFCIGQGLADFGKSAAESQYGGK